MGPAILPRYDSDAVKARRNPPMSSAIATTISATLIQMAARVVSKREK
jgi:hypothetical protein